MAAVNGKPIKRAGGSKAKKAEDERIVAVDWALSKDKWQKSQNADGEDVKMEDGADRSESESGSEDSDAESGSEDGSEIEDTKPEEIQDGEEVESEDEEKPAKPALPPVDVGSTLFIRNLPFEATEPELTEM